MAVATAPDRPWLPLPYAAILIGEVAALGTLVAMFGRHPPAAYELGWVGAGSMIAMQLYSVRRRVRLLRNLGALRTWLDAHIFLGLQGFVCVAYHSIGIDTHATLAAVNFGLVATVVVTGMIGRYLYAVLARARAEHAMRWFSRWSLVHRPLAVLVFGITALHVLAHFAYAT
jgi:hypothetical protein